MLKPILSSIDYSWEIKYHCIDLLGSIMDGTNTEEHNDDNDIDFSSVMPSLFTTLQVLLVADLHLISSYFIYHSLDL